MSDHESHSDSTYLSRTDHGLISNTLSGFLHGLAFGSLIGTLRAAWQYDPSTQRIFSNSLLLSNSRNIILKNAGVFSTTAAAFSLTDSIIAESFTGKRGGISTVCGCLAAVLVWNVGNGKAVGSGMLMGSVGIVGMMLFAEKLDFKVIQKATASERFAQAES